MRARPREVLECQPNTDQPACTGSTLGSVSADQNSALNTFSYTLTPRGASRLYERAKNNKALPSHFLSRLWWKKEEGVSFMLMGESAEGAPPIGRGDRRSKELRLTRPPREIAATYSKTHTADARVVVRGFGLRAVRTPERKSHQLLWGKGGEKGGCVEG